MPNAADGVGRRTGVVASHDCVFLRAVGYVKSRSGRRAATLAFFHGVLEHMQFYGKTNSRVFIYTARLHDLLLEVLSSGCWEQNNDDKINELAYF